MTTNLKDSLPDFSGKCLSISIMDNDISHDLYDPRFEIQGSRLFIVGTVPEGATVSNWVAHHQTAIAWDRVTDYFVFDNLDDYHTATNISENYSSDSNDK